MTDWSINLSQEAIDELAESFRQGPILEINNGRGLRLLTEETIARFDGLKVEVFSNEHPPPHFRVKYQSSTANYTIANCSRINGNGEVLKYEKNIALWWRDNKSALIECWNRLRPTDCPVGAYIEPSECKS